MLRLTYDGSRLCGLDERQGAVVGLLGDVDEALLQLVLLEDAVQLVEEAHPLVPLLIAVGQDQDGGLVVGGGGEQGRRHLGGRGRVEGCVRTIQILSKFWFQSAEKTYSEYTGDVFATGVDDIRGQDRTY